MARFDVYPMRGSDDCFLVAVSSPLIDGLGVRVVVPLVPPDRVPPATPRLHPQISLNGQRLVLVTHMIAAVPISDVPVAIGSASQEEYAIGRALDLIFYGF
ncbi:CcdB family protein [Chthonobacter rhizosphaerae]|uniref:CcdB family protein n=1 Tax=Chthonobacter rhizosphaerae TaxID=2735553 RepID=UPI0015EE6A8D|nr:CcdB family protein [Chthonobacter rhizosphaerae]